MNVRHKKSHWIIYFHSMSMYLVWKTLVFCFLHPIGPWFKRSSTRSKFSREVLVGSWFSSYVYMSSHASHYHLVRGFYFFFELHVFPKRFFELPMIGNSFAHNASSPTHFVYNLKCQKKGLRIDLNLTFSKKSMMVQKILKGWIIKRFIFRLWKILMISLTPKSFLIWK